MCCGFSFSLLPSQLNINNLHHDDELKRKWYMRWLFQISRLVARPSNRLNVAFFGLYYYRGLIKRVNSAYLYWYPATLQLQRGCRDARRNGAPDLPGTGALGRPPRTLFKWPGHCHRRRTHEAQGEVTSRLGGLTGIRRRPLGPSAARTPAWAATRQFQE